jgi:hypothetical protein
MVRFSFVSVSAVCVVFTIFCMLVSCFVLFLCVYFLLFACCYCFLLLLYYKVVLNVLCDDYVFFISFINILLLHNICY